MKFLHLSLAFAASMGALNAADELPFSIETKSVLAENDFTNNDLASRPWSIRFGEWFIKNGELLSKENAEQHHPPSMSLFFTMPETHLFSFDFRLSEGGKMRVALFGKGGLKFLINQERLAVSASDKSDRENYPFTVAAKEVKLRAGRKHHVDLVVSGQRIVAMLDGKHALAAQDPKINDHGKRYQFSMSPECSFDNFKLSEIELNQEAFSKVDFKTGKKPKTEAK